MRAAAAAAPLGAPGTGWEPRQPPSPLPSPPRAEPAPGGGFSRGAPPFSPTWVGGPNPRTGLGARSRLTSNAAAACGFRARCQSPLGQGRRPPPRSPRSTGIACPGIADAPAPAERSPLNPAPGPVPAPPAPHAHTPSASPPATPLPSGAGEGQARLVPASNLPRVNSGFPRPAGSAWAPGPPGGREGGERRVLPGLPPPPRLEADRRYKRPGRGPAVASVSADAQAVGRGRSGARGAAAGRAEAARGSPWATPMRGLSAAALCWSYSSAEGSLHTAGWAGLQRCRSL